ncbi:MAG: CCE_0567 family metalloprotein, partial [Campylobacterales bacterium]
KREATEIASEIHDIVEDTIWTDYPKLKELSEELIKRCDKYTEFKKENNL